MTELLKSETAKNAKILPSALHFIAKAFLLLLVFSFIFTASPEISAQKKKPKSKVVAPKVQTIPRLPKVTQIDEAALKNLLKPNGKPLLVNFWATWCDPCREEFPDLVKIGADYKDKVDLITISLDELSEIDNDVPKFLAEMKSETPAYLLKVPDEGAAIALVTKDWQGGLPFTVLYNEKGEIAYFRQGKIKVDDLRGAIDKLVPKTSDKN